MAATGEGSRGGKVIGHTKSGNPIYAPSTRIGKMAQGAGSVGVGSAAIYGIARVEHQAATKSEQADKLVKASLKEGKKLLIRARGVRTQKLANKLLSSAEHNLTRAGKLQSVAHANVTKRITARRIGIAVGTLVIGGGLTKTIEGIQGKEASTTEKTAAHMAAFGISSIGLTSLRKALRAVNVENLTKVGKALVKRKI